MTTDKKKQQQARYMQPVSIYTRTHTLQLLVMDNLREMHRLKSRLARERRECKPEKFMFTFGIMYTGVHKHVLSRGSMSKRDENEPFGMKLCKSRRRQLSSTALLHLLTRKYIQESQTFAARARAA